MSDNCFIMTVQICYIESWISAHVTKNLISSVNHRSLFLHTDVQTVLSDSFCLKRILFISTIIRKIIFW